ncbi:MAG: cyclomaltodextrinase N-terminal domain-containing protein [Acidobacteriia bacterium]|nr:cyclomaltodextrinase N-terminal domain-containing protein [Terriglobia bacterium]
MSKLDPPNWWVGLTPEVMLLLSGHGLEEARVACNLPGLRVTRTQAGAGGNYLFVWLKIGPGTKAGTADCRVTTPAGAAKFAWPLAARSAPVGKFAGLSPDDVIYLIMPDRFANGDPANDEPAAAPGSRDRANPHAYHGGDLRGIREHLPYLQELGVTALWLTPVVKNGATEDYHGYGAVDLYATDEHLGTLEEYRKLVDAAHRAGMKVLFDVVVNHVGPRHPWVANPPLADWFHGTRERHTNSSAAVGGDFYGQPANQPVSNDLFEALADPHAPPRLWRNLVEGWFVGILPDLNTDNPLVGQYLLQNNIWWVETSGLDGLRLDTFPYSSRRSWAEWHAGLHQIYPSLTTIGEVFHPDASVTSFFAGGQTRYDGIDSGLSTLFDYPLRFALRDVLLRGAPVGRLAGVLRQDALYPHPERLVTFFSNHDVKRFASEPGSSPAILKLAYGLLLTMRGIPQLYYGDEIGMPGGDDPDNRRDFPGGWAQDPRSAFAAAGRTPAEEELFAYVQALLRLRREHVALRRGRQWHLAVDAGVYTFARECAEESLLIIANTSDHPRTISVPLEDTPLRGIHSLSAVLSAEPGSVQHGQAEARIAAKSVAVYVAK